MCSSDPHHDEFIFNIIGDGEMFNELRNFIDINNLNNNVRLHGHLENRVLINNILRSSNLFFFPSLSEGSPRVIIEAMSQGVAVMSTPVVSLPMVFKDKADIRFFNFIDIDSAMTIIYEYLVDNLPFELQWKKAYLKIKENYT